MRKTFSLGQSNELIQDGRVYDLHNFYRFSGFFYEVKGKRLQIRFDRISGKFQGASSIVLLFLEVNYLELSPNFGEKEIDGIDEIGYKSPTDRDDEWLLGESQANIDDHLFLRLDEGYFIRVHSKYAELNVLAKPSVLSI